MQWLVLLFLVAGGVTLVGHGMWVLVATICRVLFSDPSESTVRCRRCGRNGSLSAGTCRSCGESLWLLPSEEEADLPPSVDSYSDGNPGEC